MTSTAPAAQPARPAPTAENSPAGTDGLFGPFGGRFIPETLIPAVQQLEQAYLEAKAQPEFWQQLDHLLKQFVGRPTPLQMAPRLSQHVGCRVYLKREDLNHTGAHKINNTLGQALLAIRMGKQRIIAETGAGQHGVATATACAALGLEAVVYMGAEDVRRQALNVFRMRLMGTTVVPVHSGQKTLKDAINEAMRDWMGSVQNTHYIIGSVMGPHPFPTIVRDFQSVIGRETRQQILEAEKRLPDAVVACVGGGSNAAGIFHPFQDDPSVQLIGVEAAGHGLDANQHAATIARGRVGVIHGMKTIVLQDDDGQTSPVHSCSAGLDYPGIGPEHAWWHTTRRARYLSCTDQQALDWFQTLSRLEGIIPALETAHAFAILPELARQLGPDAIIVVNLSGRGDKDCVEVARLLGMPLEL